MANLSVLLMLIGQTWAKAYDVFHLGSSYIDTAYSIVYDNVDDAYITVGHTTPGILATNEVLVTKIKVSDGTVMWSKNYGFPGEFRNMGRSIIVDHDGDGFYVIAGYCKPSQTGKTNPLILKVKASDGELVWGNTYPTTYGVQHTAIDAYAFSIVKSGGDYLVAGNVEPGPCGDPSDAMVLSVNSATGVINWAWAYSNTPFMGMFPTNEYAYSIIEDSTTSPCSLFVVAGKRYAATALISAMLVFKGKKSDGSIDPATKFIYDYMAAPVTQGRYDCAYNIKNVPGGYILTGNTDSNIVNLKLTPNLHPFWAGRCKTYHIATASNSRCIAPTSDGNYVFTGATTPGVTGTYDLLITKIDPNGGVLWANALAGCGSHNMNMDDYGKYIVEGPQNYYAAVGYTQWPTNWTPTNTLVAKINKDGFIDCPQATDTCFKPVTVVVDSPVLSIDSSFIDCALDLTSLTLIDTNMTVRDTLICWHSIGIDDNGCSCNRAIYEIYNMPNPCIFKTTIHYGLKTDGNVKVSIYDLSGRTIKVLSDSWVKSGKHNIIWDGLNETGQNALPGVYLYKIQTGKSTETHKLLKIK
ncbi:MAG: T9SS type A sorting domain-containing protein [bacterium]|nr:T9SS type A sorting domain-containing protein [bacterium]